MAQVSADDVNDGAGNTSWGSLLNLMEFPCLSSLPRSTERSTATDERKRNIICRQMLVSPPPLYTGELLNYFSFVLRLCVAPLRFHLTPNLWGWCSRGRPF